MHFSGLARKDLLGNVKTSDEGLSAGIDKAIRRRRKHV
jgi:hypothetical protein